VKIRLFIFSGGTEVTVSGSQLNSVAEPRITLTVVITNIPNSIEQEPNTSSTKNSEVIDVTICM